MHVHAHRHMHTHSNSHPTNFVIQVRERERRRRKKVYFKSLVSFCPFFQPHHLCHAEICLLSLLPLSGQQNIPWKWSLWNAFVEAHERTQMRVQKNTHLHPWSMVICDSHKTITGNNANKVHWAVCDYSANKNKWMNKTAQWCHWQYALWK